ncbi:hypothetical protein TNCV_3901201 [Trichonephila clavipes]|nr:hypothetical protein TNCV_3901201 [Trichonephila clavipes]
MDVSKCIVPFQNANILNSSRATCSLVRVGGRKREVDDPSPPGCSPSKLGKNPKETKPSSNPHPERATIDFEASNVTMSLEASPHGIRYRPFSPHSDYR